MNPEVSILVLTYNQADKIGRALDSILAQQCDSNYEIIIGEDASTDSTRAVCERYAAQFPEKIRLMPQAPNKGVVDNYYDCLLQSRGKYITDCAGDDYWPDLRRLQRQHDYLETHPQDVAVMSDWIIASPLERVVSRDLEKFAPFTRRCSGREMLELSLGAISNFPLLSAMMYRREALMKLYYADTSLLRRKDWKCEDFPLVAALATQGAFGYLPLDATVYEVGDASVSNSVDYGKQFDFYIGPARAMVELTRRYGVGFARLLPAFDARIKYLAAMAWKSPSKERTSQLAKLVGAWPVRVPLKARFRLWALLLFRR